MKTTLCFMIGLIIVGCAQTITLNHSQGRAEDVVDTTSTTSPDIDSAVNMSPLPL